MNTLYVVNLTPSGPTRCNRCKAYMNPFCRFIDGGRRYVCPICQCSNEGECTNECPGLCIFMIDVSLSTMQWWICSPQQCSPYWNTCLDHLMSQIPDLFSGNKTSEVVLEPVVQAGLEALKATKRNSRLFIFHSNLPMAPAPGQLSNRLDTQLLGTDKEKITVM